MGENRPVELSRPEIRAILLEAWYLGEVADSVAGSDPERWISVAKEVCDDLDIFLEPPFKEKSDGPVYLRANHGFPIEMHWQSDQAKHWLHAVPSRRENRNMWNDMFLERGGLA